MRFSHRVVLSIVAAVFLVAHARALPRTLEDIDSINLALGVESFDVASHRPHPPGYPVFIAMSRISTAAVGALAPSWDRDRRAAVGLAVWGLIAGTLAVFVIAELLMAIGFTPLHASLAATICVASPLFWFSAVRPLTDVPGLVAALLVQTCLARGLRVVRSGAAGVPREWILGAAGAGLIVGLRSQTMWLTGPLLLWCASLLVVRRQVRGAFVLAIAAAAGILVWAVPLVIDSGGPGAYWRSVRFQGDQDLTGIEMLATTPTARLLKVSLRRTFADPWLLTGLANVLLGFMLIGGVQLARRERPVLWLLLLLFVPYLLFHLAFHETVTLRYGLPVVVLISALAVAGFSILGNRVTTVLAAAAALVGVVFVQPRLEAYAEGGWPVVRAFQDMQRALPASGEQPELRMHHQVWHGVRRLIEWYRPHWDVGPQPFPGDREWLAAVSGWRTGSTRQVWFLTDVTRNDMTLFDRRSRTLGGRYELPARLRDLVGGYRLDGLNWWRIEPPGWMLGTGWSLTPEIAGMTAQDASGPHQRPAEAFVRRTRRPLRLMLGGRYLAPAGSPAGTISVDLEGKRLADWPISASAPSFLHWLELPDGVPDGPGPYSLLTVRVTSADPGRPAPAAGLEQFDIAPADEFISALAEGWFEPEEDPRTGRLWHWTADRATMLVVGGSADLRLTLAGESPLRYFPRAPNIVVRAGDIELARFSPSSDFSRTIDVPAAVLVSSGGRITIETESRLCAGGAGRKPGPAPPRPQDFPGGTDPALTRVEVRAARGFLATHIRDVPTGRSTTDIRACSTMRAASKARLMGAAGTRRSESDAVSARPVTRSSQRTAQVTGNVTMFVKVIRSMMKPAPVRRSARRRLLYRRRSIVKAEWDPRRISRAATLSRRTPPGLRTRNISRTAWCSLASSRQ